MAGDFSIIVGPNLWKLLKNDEDDDVRTIEKESRE